MLGYTCPCCGELIACVPKTMWKRDCPCCGASVATQKQARAAANEQAALVKGGL